MLKKGGKSCVFLYASCVSNTTFMLYDLPHNAAQCWFCSQDPWTCLKPW